MYSVNKTLTYDTLFLKEQQTHIIVDYSRNSKHWDLKWNSI